MIGSRPSAHKVPEGIYIEISLVSLQSPPEIKQET